MIIRKMKKSDLPQVCQIEDACFPYGGWNKAQFEYELNENPYACLWVMVDDNNRVIGYYDLWIIFERAEIATIAIDKAYQHQGLGSKLMNHLENEAKKKECETIALEVRTSNEAALAMYQSHDFTIINTKPGYYQAASGFEDGYFMMKGI